MVRELDPGQRKEQEEMLNFQEHMKGIINLAEKALIHTQEEKYPLIRDDLIRISIHCNEALQQLDDMVLLKQQGKNPAERITG